MSERLRKQLLDTSRGRIVTVLRAGGLTSDDIARSLGLTRSAVRIQIAAMERDGLVQRAGKRPGATRPSLVFELTADIEQLLSQAYVPLLIQLVDVFAEALPSQEFEALLRKTGRKIASELSAGKDRGGDLTSRLQLASDLLNQHLGAVSRVEINGRNLIRGTGCPLAALTAHHPVVCLAIESFVTEVVGAPAHECCDRSERPRCCFEVPAV